MARAAMVKSGSFVHMLGEFVFDVGVRGHLVATLGPRPFFRRSQKRGAHTFAAIRLGDKPALDITYG
jgi:hypothetical protein